MVFQLFFSLFKVHALKQKLPQKYKNMQVILLHTFKHFKSTVIEYMTWFSVPEHYVNIGHIEILVYQYKYHHKY